MTKLDMLILDGARILIFVLGAPEVPPKGVPKIEVHGTYPCMVSSKHSGTHTQTILCPLQKINSCFGRSQMAPELSTVQSKKQNWNDNNHNRKVSRQCTEWYLQCKHGTVLNITGSYKYKQLIQQLLRSLEITVDKHTNYKNKRKIMNIQTCKRR